MTPQQIELAKLALQQKQIYLQSVMGIVTALIGIVGVVIGQWAVRRSTDRKALDDYWYQYSVKDGTEPLIEYLSNLNDRLGLAMDKATNKVGSRTQPETMPLPHRALGRVKKLTGNHDIFVIAITADYMLGHDQPFEKLNSLHKQTLHVRRFLDLYETLFISSRLQHKSDIVLAASRPPVVEITFQFREMIREGLDQPKVDEGVLSLLSAINMFGDLRQSKRRLNKIKKMLPNQYTADALLNYHTASDDSISKLSKG